MSWSKQKQQLEGFLSPALVGRVGYASTSYRYSPDRSGACYLTVDKKNILNMRDKTSTITWYQAEMDIKNDPVIQLVITEADIEEARKTAQGPIPEERLPVIARGRKVTVVAKEIFAAQASLSKSSFTTTATKFLASSLEDSLASEDILLNILALIDRRLGKKRLLQMASIMKQKHPAVQYFYQLRVDGK